jgi:hypothetical protein
MSWATLAAPRALVPDNLKAAVTKASRYDALVDTSLVRTSL